MSDPIDIRTMIDKHKSEQVEAVLASVPTEVPGDLMVLPNPQIAADLAAEDYRLGLQEMAIKERRSALRKAMTMLAGDKSGVAGPDGKKVYSVSSFPTTRVNTDVVKENFPPEKYPAMWKVSEESRVTVTPEFKATVQLNAQGELRS